jgi:hypothetical protein
VLTFYVIVAAIYAAECVYRVENGGLALTGVRRRRWRAHVGPMLALGRQGGMSVAPLLPPLATPTAWPAASITPSQPASALSAKSRKEAAAATDRFYKVAEPVWIGGNTLWVYLFVAAPAVVYWRGLAATWPTLLLSGLVILAFTLYAFWTAHAELFPGGRAERREKTILMALSPLGAVRAVDHLSWRLLAGTHPLVAAVELCDRGDAVRLARWMYFAAPDAALQRFLQECDLWEAVTSPPDAGEPGASTFCPRCHAQYSRDSGECSDCAGVGLVQIRAG